MGTIFLVSIVLFAELNFTTTKKIVPILVEQAHSLKFFVCMYVRFKKKKKSRKKGGGVFDHSRNIEAR